MIDFGLAKAIGETSLHDQTHQTEFGLILGTLKYMSPEQAGFGTGTIDTRTDIYALGNILYELLTGSTPINDETLRENPKINLLELICNQPVSKPSLRMSDSSAEAQSEITRKRSTDSIRLQRRLAGDLDRIVIKSLQKDPELRYETASGLKSDVVAFLENRPVVAQPPTRSYLVKKFYQRNKLATWLSLAVATSVLVGAVGSTWGYISADREAKRANRLAASESTARAAAEQLAEKEKAARIEIQESREQLQRAAAMLKAVFEGINPELVNAGDATLRKNMIDRLEQCARDLLKDDVAGERDLIDLMSSLAHSLSALGSYEEALMLREQLVEETSKFTGEDRREAITALQLLSKSLLQVGQSKEGLLATERANRLARELAPDDSANLIREDHMLAHAFMAANELDKAYELRKELMKRIIDADLQGELIWSDSLLAMGMLQFKRNKFAEAAEANRKAIKALSNQVDGTHPLALIARENLAMCQQKLGDVEGAVETYRDVLAVRSKQFPDNSPAIGLAKMNLAVALATSGENKEAITLLKNVQETQQREDMKFRAKVKQATIEAAYMGKDGAIEELKALKEQAIKDFGKSNPIVAETQASLDRASAIKAAGASKSETPDSESNPNDEK